MKKAAAFLAAVCLALSMAACGSGDKSDKASGSAAAPSKTPAQEAMEENADEDNDNNENDDGDDNDGDNGITANAEDEKVIEDAAADGDPYAADRMPVNDIINYDIEILGNKVTLPCTLSDLKGVQLDPESFSYNDGYTPHSTHADLTYTGEDGEQHYFGLVYFEGKCDDEESAKSAKIIHLELQTNLIHLPDDAPMVSYNGIDHDSTPEDVIAKFGEPGKTNSDSSLMYYYFEPIEGAHPKACFVLFWMSGLENNHVSQIELAYQRPLLMD